MFNPVTANILFCLVVWANAAVFWSRASKLEAARPELGREPSNVVKAFAIWCSVPFLLGVLGSAMGLSGRSVPPRPSDVSRPFDYLETAVIVVFLIRFLLWIFLQGGAGVLARNASVIGPVPRSPWAVKVWAAVLASLAVLSAIYQTAA